MLDGCGGLPEILGLGRQKWGTWSKLVSHECQITKFLVHIEDPASVCKVEMIKKDTHPQPLPSTYMHAVVYTRLHTHVHPHPYTFTLHTRK